MADAKSKEQLDREWWDAWWAEDYSWEGLGKLKPDGEPLHPWVGWVFDKDAKSIHEADSQHAKDAGEARLRPATLQDYWRDQAGDLINSPDEPHQFTRVHLPLHWRDGTPTGKTDWADKALDAILSPKLVARTDTNFSAVDRVEGADRRTQLQGAVLLRAATHPIGREKPVHLQCTHACFARSIDFSQQVFGPGARFASATFCGEAQFAGATFPGYALFKSATFSGHAWFMGATFSGHALFDSATFSGEAEFLGAKFHETVTFADGRFDGVASFHGADVHPSVTFDNARFRAVDRALLRASMLFWIIVLLVLGTAGVAPVLSGWAQLLAWGAAGVLAVSALAWSMLGGSELVSDRWKNLRPIRDNVLEEHIRAFRRLTLISEGVNNRRDAAKFYVLELKATRLRRRTNTFERFASWTYDWVADYGDSFWRPLVAVTGVVAAFAVVFWAWEGGATFGGPAKWPGQAASVDSNFVDSVRYSLSRTFPFGPWAINDDRLTSVKECGFASRLQALDVAPSAVSAVPGVAPEMIKCRPRGGWNEAQLANHRLLVGIVGTLESLLSLPLYFLFGLAVRRKFQIS